MGGQPVIPRTQKMTGNFWVVSFNILIWEFNHIVNIIINQYYILLHILPQIAYDKYEWTANLSPHCTLLISTFKVIKAESLLNSKYQNKIWFGSIQILVSLFFSLFFAFNFIVFNWKIILLTEINTRVYYFVKTDIVTLI